MSATAFVSAVSFASAAAFVMMAAHFIRIVGKNSVQKILYRLIGISGRARIYLNPGFRQCLSGTAAYSAAYQCLHILLFQESGQCTM